MPGKLRVFLSHATGLRAADKDGLSDPYIKLTLGGRTEKSEVVHKTLDPRFDWEFVYAFDSVDTCFMPMDYRDDGIGLVPTPAVLRLEAWDWDKRGPNDSLGKGQMPLAEYRRALEAGDSAEIVVPLEYKPLMGRVQAAGHVHLRLSWQVDGVLPTPMPEPSGLPPPAAPIVTAPPPMRTATGGYVKIFVSRATDLKAADRDGLSDPYVKVRMNQMVERSAVFKKTLSPTFNWEFTFRFEHVDDACRTALEIEAFDHDGGSLNDPLGDGLVALNAHKETLSKWHEPIDLVVALKDKKRIVPTGMLRMGMGGGAGGAGGSASAQPAPRGKLHVHLSRATGLRAADDNGLSDPFIKLMVGGRTELSEVAKKTLNPNFNWDFAFRFDDADDAFGSQLRLEAWDHDQLSMNDALGHGLVALAEHRKALEGGASVDVPVALRYKPVIGAAVPAGQAFITLRWESLKPVSTVNDGKVFLSLSWEPDIPFDPPETAPLLPEPEPEPQKPKPTLLICVSVGVPMTLTLLAWGAGYTVPAVMFAFTFPFICIIAYLMTPLAPPDDDPNEPPLPTMEAYVPGPLLVVLNAIFALIEWGYNLVFGTILAILGPAIAPHVLLIAQALQLSMGIMAIVEVGVGFAEIHTIAQALITLIMTMIALPDSFGWAIKPGTCFGDLWNRGAEWFNKSQRGVEVETSFTADKYNQKGTERMEVLKEQAAEVAASLPAFLQGDGTPNPVMEYFRPFVRLALVNLDGIGEAVRGSPLLVVVLVLDGTIAINDFRIPPLHIYALHIFNFFFPSRPNPTQYAIEAEVPATSFAGEIVGLVNGTCEHLRKTLFRGGVATMTTALAAACGALDEVGGSFCADEQGWPQRVNGANVAREGARFIFEHPMQSAYIDILYHLKQPNGWRDASGGSTTWWEQTSPATFSFRLEFYENETLDATSEIIATRRAYDVHVSASLVETNKQKDRNVTIVPLESGLPIIMLGATRKPHPHYQTVPERFLHLEPIMKIKKMLQPKELPAWQNNANLTSACPRPLRLRMLPWGCDHKGCNGTHHHPETQSVGITFLDGSERAASLATARELASHHGKYHGEAWSNKTIEAIDIMIEASAEEVQLDVGLDAIEIEGRYSDSSHPEYEHSEFSFEYEDEEEEAEEEAAEFTIPIEEITSILAAVATAAASSEFVRKHVKPEEYAKGKAREGGKKDAQLARGGAEAAIKALMTTPLDKIDIEEAKKAIDDAEDADVLPSMIDKLVERVQEAIELQMMSE